MAEEPQIWIFLSVTQGLGSSLCHIIQVCLAFPLMGHASRSLPNNMSSGRSRAALPFARHGKHNKWYHLYSMLWETDKQAACRLRCLALGLLCNPGTLVRKLWAKAIKTKFSVWPFQGLPQPVPTCYSSITACPSPNWRGRFWGAPLPASSQALLTLVHSFSNCDF